MYDTRAEAYRLPQMKGKILHGNCLEVLRQLPDSSVHCCVTSPPYFGLRNYGTDAVDWPAVEFSLWGFPVSIPEITCELGHEPNPLAFAGHLVLIFREVRRVLRDDGTLWLNLGDSYGGSWGAMSHDPKGKAKYMGFNTRPPQSRKSFGIKGKDLIGIPSLIAHVFRDDGWYWRQDIIWAKAVSTLKENRGSAMPESVRDRFVKSHEYVHLFSKSEQYYFDLDAVKKPIRDSSIARLMQDTASQAGSEVPGKSNGTMKAVVGHPIGGKKHSSTGEELNRTKSGKEWTPSHAGSGLQGHSNNSIVGQAIHGAVANKRSVWHHNPANFGGDHFATFPEDLIWDMVLAGCPRGGVVLDPFFGRGTTGVVARKQDKNYIGIELSAKNVRMAENFLHQELGVFK